MPRPSRHVSSSFLSPLPSAAGTRAAADDWRANRATPASSHRLLAIDVASVTLRLHPWRVPRPRRRAERRLEGVQQRQLLRDRVAAALTPVASVARAGVAAARRRGEQPNLPPLQPPVRFTVARAGGRRQKVGSNFRPPMRFDSCERYMRQPTDSATAVASAAPATPRPHPKIKYRVQHRVQGVVKQRDAQRRGGVEQPAERREARRGEERGQVAEGPISQVPRRRRQRGRVGRQHEFQKVARPAHQRDRAAQAHGAGDPERLARRRPHGLVVAPRRRARDARRRQRRHDRQHEEAEIKCGVGGALAGQRQRGAHAPDEERVDHADHGEDRQAQHRWQRDGGDLFVEGSASASGRRRGARAVLCGVARCSRCVWPP